MSLTLSAAVQPLPVHGVTLSLTDGHGARRDVLVSRAVAFELLMASIDHSAEILDPERDEVQAMMQAGWTTGGQGGQMPSPMFLTQVWSEMEKLPRT